MKTVDLQSWGEFKPAIDGLRETYGYYQDKSSGLRKEKNTILFRGQQCAEWPIKSTLERKSVKEFTVTRYLNLVQKNSYELFSYTGTKWEISEFNDIIEETRKSQDQLFGPKLPHLDYLIYLRHHGYPSPLIDWSESPYIAAYFAAFESAESKSTPEARFAIFVYISTIDNVRSFEGGKPRIKPIGPFVKTHKRHFVQKAQYTLAAKWSEEANDFVFCSHHEVFDAPNQIHPQDIVIKLTLPIGERKTVLKELEDVNINHFTLFQTEDALVKALAIRDFELDEL